jgi:RND family efflux transporter MFP subunit
VPVYLGLADEPDYPHVGTVNFVDNRMDPMTGTIRLRGVFENPQRLLPPGLFVRIRMPIGVPYEALLLPEKALGSSQGQKYVYVLDDKNMPARRTVEVGALQGDMRVITRGVARGERVVLEGLQQVRVGEAVTIQPASKPAEKAAATDGSAAQSPDKMAAAAGPATEPSPATKPKKETTATAADPAPPKR